MLTLFPRYFKKKSCWLRGLIDLTLSMKNHWFMNYFYFFKRHKKSELDPIQNLNSDRIRIVNIENLIHYFSPHLSLFCDGHKRDYVNQIKNLIRWFPSYFLPCYSWACLAQRHFRSWIFSAGSDQSESIVPTKSFLFRILQHVLHTFFSITQLQKCKVSFLRKRSILHKLNFSWKL